MADRLNLHEEFCKLLGTRNVYFDAPEKITMAYPAIRYVNSRFNNRKANNKLYMSMKGYEVTIIDGDPDSELREKILERFPYCKFDRSYKSDGLNHYVFTLYY